MKITETKDGTISVKVGPGFHACAAAAGTIILAYAAVKEINGPGVDTTYLAGSLAGLLFFLAICVLLFRKSVFRFEPFSQRLVWRRIGLFGVKSGHVGFTDIRDIVIDSTGTLGGGRPGYRLVVLTAGGKVPLTNSFVAERPKCEALAARLLELLCRDAEKLTERSLEHLVAEGRLIDATRVVMEERAISLTEARNLVGTLVAKHGKKGEADEPQAATTEKGEQEVERLAASGSKMKAIKLYRRIHNTDLKTSRQEVEKIILRLRGPMQYQK